MPIATQRQLTTRLFRWLYTLLSTDATLQTYIGSPGRVYRYQDYELQIPPTYPIVVFQQTSSLPMRPVGPISIGADKIVLIKAIDKGNSMTTLEAIMDRVYALVDNATGSIPGATVIYSQIKEDLDPPPETYNGVSYQSLGCNVRVMIQ